LSYQKTLVCFGDSITEGTIGASYIDILRQRLPACVHVVNAGVNGDTTLNLLRRVERDVVRRRPDLVVIMVGLNDIATAYGELASWPYYRAIKRVGGALTPQRFARAYRRLIATLRERTGAILALCTLTTIGEEPGASVQPFVDAYSNIIRALAHQECLPLIDVRAAFCDAIAANPYDGPPYHIWTPLLDSSAIRLRGQSYETLAARRGYRLLCDGVHLSHAGAELVAETMLPMLDQAIRCP
jgi:lysophospholipase L1-like esterase